MSNYNCDEFDTENVQVSEVGTCPAVSRHEVDVCLPVAVIPFAKSGTPIMRCCNAPIISTESPCTENKGDICSFTLTQRMCVEIPVTFGANVAIGDTYVNCSDVSAKAVCGDCCEEDEEE